MKGRLREKVGPKQREAIFLILLLLTLAFLYNKLNFSADRWTLHPDDYNNYVYSNVLLETGHLWYQSPYNQRFDVDAFMPGLDGYQSAVDEGHKLWAPYSPGIYMLSCLTNLLGLRGPFVLVAFMGVLGVLFLYLLVRDLYGIQAAMAAAVLLGFTSTYIYWSNMFFSGIPALCLFLGGLLFLERAIRSEGGRWWPYAVSVGLLAMAVWVRYEFILLASLVVIILLVAYRRKVSWRHVLAAGALVLAAGAVIAGLNFLTTRSVIGLHPATGAGSKATEMLFEYPSQIGWRTFGTLYDNARMYVYGVAPVMTVAGAVGIAWCLRKKRDWYLGAFLALAVLVLFYYGKNRGFWGFGAGVLAASYTRYFLPVMAVLAVFAALLAARYLGSGTSRTAAALLVAGFLAAHIIVSVNIASNARFGLDFTDDYCAGRKAMNSYAAELADDAVVVDITREGFYNYQIISRTVFVPYYLEKKSRRKRAARIISDLHLEGVPLIVIDNPELSVFKLEALQGDLAGLDLERIEHPVTYEVPGRGPDIYRVIAGE